MSGASTTTRVRLVPSSSTKRSWYALSSKSGSLKPIPNEWSVSGYRLRASAAVSDESSPPLRYAATGTSARRRIRVASVEELVQLRHELGLARGSLVADPRELEVPPAPSPRSGRPGRAEVVGGRELADADERRAVGQDRPGRERLDEPERVELASRRGVAEERLRLRREAEVAAELGEEERTHAEAVPREEELLLAAVPDRDREVAVQAVRGSRRPTPRTRARSPRCRTRSRTDGRAPGAPRWSST